MASPGFELSSLKKLFSVSDFVVAMFLVVVIGLMLVPLPTFILDLLITGSISFSLIILLVAMFLKEALEFASFPSVLLIVTIFRLS
ncbi:MAG: FHIPEP family type III secretion protein, partial [Candidatus Margulisbacteria bacterium]|nr:FHIPEP family type III secretion protein [Candidatus Margulisiibacteriota bacterium]